MKNIEIDEDLYQYIASNTQFIGESASSILRRLLAFKETPTVSAQTDKLADAESVVVKKSKEKVISKTKIAVSKKNKPVEKNKKKTVTRNNDETVFNYINKEELAMQRGAVGRFLLILAALYRGNTAHFSAVTDICGRDRLYFANNAQALDDSGSSTKPRQIPDSPYWVITNSNTTRKKMMLTQVAIALGYSEDDAEMIRELL